MTSEWSETPSPPSRIAERRRQIHDDPCSGATRLRGCNAGWSASTPEWRSRPGALVRGVHSHGRLAHHHSDHVAVCVGVILLAVFAWTHQAGGLAGGIGARSIVSTASSEWAEDLSESLRTARVHSQVRPRWPSAGS